MTDHHHYSGELIGVADDRHRHEDLDGEVNRLYEELAGTQQQVTELAGRVRDLETEVRELAGAIRTASAGVQS